MILAYEFRSVGRKVHAMPSMSDCVYIYVCGAVSFLSLKEPPQRQVGRQIQDRHLQLFWVCCAICMLQEVKDLVAREAEEEPVPQDR